MAKKKGKWIKFNTSGTPLFNMRCYGGDPITLIPAKEGYRIHLAACWTKYRYIKDVKKEENKKES